MKQENIVDIVASSYFGVEPENVTMYQRQRTKEALHVYFYTGDNYTIEYLIQEGTRRLAWLDIVDGHSQPVQEKPKKRLKTLWQQALEDLFFWWKHGT